MFIDINSVPMNARFIVTFGKTSEVRLVDDVETTFYQISYTVSNGVILIEEFETEELRDAKYLEITTLLVSVPE